MDVFEIVISIFYLMCLLILQNWVMSFVYEKKFCYNKQTKTIQVQFFNKDNYKRWKKISSERPITSLIDQFLDIITHINFKYYHIKHGGEKKFCFIIRNSHYNLPRRTKTKAILKINTVHAKVV